MHGGKIAVHPNVMRADIERDGRLGRHHLTQLVNDAQRMHGRAGGMRAFGDGRGDVGRSLREQRAKARLDFDAQPRRQSIECGADVADQLRRRQEGLILIGGDRVDGDDRPRQAFVPGDGSYSIGSKPRSRHNRRRRAAGRPADCRKGRPARHIAWPQQAPPSRPRPGTSTHRGSRSTRESDGSPRRCDVPRIACRESAWAGGPR